jgi:hypothetical protein
MQEDVREKSEPNGKTLRIRNAEKGRNVEDMGRDDACGLNPSFGAGHRLSDERRRGQQA